MANRKGVSVIVASVLLIFIALATSVMIYSTFSQNLVPTADTNRLIEDLRIVNVDVSNITGNVTLYVLNRGGIDLQVDYCYIETLSQNTLFVNQTSPPTLVPVGQSRSLNFTVFNASVLSGPIVFKVVTVRGTTSSYLYAPQTSTIENPPFEAGGGSGVKQFYIQAFKFNDTNLNGTYEPWLGESGVPNFHFILECENGTLIPGLTDANGYYNFSGLNKGTYTVDDYSQNDPVSGLVWNYSTINQIIVPITSSSANVSFGNFLNNPVYSIRGTIFNDLNQNGGIDMGEGALAGWIVIIKYVSGPAFFAAVTDATGNYTFGNLPPGNYIVQEILKQGWIPTTPLFRNVLITNQSVTGINFGDFNFGINGSFPYSINGLVFNDSNKNGVRDTGENGLAGWVLTIDNGSGILYGAVTDANGNYSFPVGNGNYTISEILPLNWQTSTGYVRFVTVANASVYGQDFGNYYSPPHIFAIRGTVFNDTNQNGIYDAGDLPLPNWIVNYNDSGLPFYVLTDANGNYQITHLAAGTYIVSAFMNSSWTNTTAQIQTVVINAASVNGINFGLRQLVMSNITCFVYSDMNLNRAYDPGIDYPLPNWTVSLNGLIFMNTNASGIAFFDNIPVGNYTVAELLPGDPYWHNYTNTDVTVNITSVPGNVSFANYYNAPKTITGIVFNDTDNSGTYNVGETGISGVTVYLNNASGSFNLQTNATGYYTFTGVTNGSCTVQIFPIPTGYTNTTARLITFQINPTDTLITLNFGVHKVGAPSIYAISGIKFNDTNGNGVYDSSSDPIIVGWRIYLYNGIYNGTGLPLSNTTTDATGAYNFPNVNNGTYTVVEGSQAGWVNTTSQLQVVVVSGSSVPVNFGNNYVGIGTNIFIYSIGGMVFNDTDKNGIKNGVDSGYPGATVVLNDYRGLPIAFSTTDANGNYSFTSLANGTYTINLILPSGYTNTTLLTVPVTIAGANVTGKDFGIFKIGATLSYSISGVVFNDTNINGNYDAGDALLTGWTVVIFNGTYNGTGLPFATSITTLSGYSFGGLVNGNYTVIEVLSSGYYNTTVRSRLITINNASVVNVNFGNYPNSTSTYAISGYIFLDVDHNGVFDGSDTGYGTSSIYIQLNDYTGYPVAYTYQITGGAAGNTGFYNFTSLSPGTYTIYIQVPSGYTNSTPSRVTTTITITNISINFGIWKTATAATYYISGWKWNDTNANGVWNAGENGMGTWSIWLYTGNYLGGVPVGTFPTAVTTTNGTLAGAAGSGFYTFSSLANGTYTVIETWTNGYTNTTAKAKLVTIAGVGWGNVNFSNTIAPLQNYNISGRVYNDKDKSGSWTQGDTGYASFSFVYINDPMGFPMTRVTTGTGTSAGNYTFFGVGNGTYRVYITYPVSGYTNTTPITLNVVVSGANRSGIDFGLNQTAVLPVYSIGGFKFNDTNGDGIYNATSDPFLSGWTILLYQGVYSGTQFPVTPIQTTAATTGAYLYSGLAAGTYTVIELMQNGWINANATRYSIVTITNISQQLIFGNSKIGVVPTYSVTGLVFNDSNRNGVLNTGEVYSGTLSVYADDSLGLPYAYVSTNSTGFFTLSGLPNGVYTIYPQIPSGWTNSTLSRIQVTISGASVSGINFGIYQTSVNATYSIGGYKFNDTNKNGVYDGTDSPINGWPIYLYSGIYTGSGFPMAMITTAGSGNYSFSGLNNGTYTVVESEMSGYSTVMQRSQVITILGNSTANVIFGNYKQVPVPPYTVTGLVFNDLTGQDGVYNGLDSGYSGATVWLNDQLGIPIGSATTNATGYYTFTNLANGTYTVYLQVPSGWTNSTPTRWPLTISGLSIQAPNIGIYQIGAPVLWDVNGYKVNDTNKNGIQDSGENLLSGWSLQLYSGIYTGVEIPIATTTTNASGRYLFGGLAAGTYTVIELVQPTWVNTTLAQRIITLNSDLTVNFTNYKTVSYSIGGKVFNDTDSNGVYNASDLPLQGWTVTLTDIGNNTYTATTDAIGNYSFTGLANGTYTISTIIQAGWQNTTASSLIANISGSSLFRNFGFNKTIPTYSITGYKFNDTNSNGVFDLGVDNRISGWSITLTYSNGTELFTATNSSGYYTFSSLVSGIYTVQEASQIGWSNVTARSLSVNITTASNSTINFGNAVNNSVTITYNLDGTVFNDTNKNGVYDVGTDGVLVNWIVTLKDQLNNLYLATTDAGGSYMFSGLAPGVYTVQEIPLLDWINTTAKIQTVTIVGSDVSGVNFGNFYTKFIIAGYVYFDVNRNGIYDSGEYPLSGWTLNLTNIGTSSQTLSNTSSSGYYSFTNLASGNYMLSVFTQQGWIPTTPVTVGINLTSNVNQNFGNNRTFFPGLFKTFTHAEWSLDTAGYLSNNFTIVYPSGFVEIGIPGVSGYSIVWANLTRMHTYLSNVFAPVALTQDWIDPATSPGGELGANVFALELNVDFSNHPINPFNSRFSSLTLYNYSAGPSLNGMTITQILGIANQVLGGGNINALAPGYTIGDLNTLLGLLNSAFTGTSDLSWANTHLF